MSLEPAGFTAALEKICTKIVGADAVDVDRDGAFPERGIKDRRTSRAGMRIDGDGGVHAPLRRDGARRVTQLIHDMDEGRRKRLVCLGFADEEAAALSALHTRNFM
jgi:hypothetical protein